MIKLKGDVAMRGNNLPSDENSKRHGCVSKLLLCDEAKKRRSYMSKELTWHHDE